MCGILVACILRGLWRGVLVGKRERETVSGCVDIRTREQEGRKGEREEEGKKAEREGRRQEESKGARKRRRKRRIKERKVAGRRKRRGWEGGRRLVPAEPTQISQPNLFPEGEEKTGVLNCCLSVGMGGLACFWVEQEVA